MALTALNLATNGFTAGDLSIKGYFAAIAAYQNIYIADGRTYSATSANSGYHKIDMASTSLVGSPSGTFTVGESVVQEGSGATGIFMETIGSGATAKNLIYRTSTTEFLISTTGDGTVTGAISTKTIDPTAVNAPPHWLPWILSTGAVTDWPDGGSNTMCLFDGRLWMNAMYNPHQWYATRQGDPLDLDTSLDDVQAAISSQVSETGLVGDAIIAFIPFKDNYLLFGCASSFGILRGGSTGSGSICNLSSETGIFSPDSWCWDNEGNLYVVGLTGFFKFPNSMATSGAAIDNISNRLLPSLFSGLKLNRLTDRVVLGFDKDSNEVHVSISTQDGAWAVNWVYDVGIDAIFPDKFPTGQIPSAYLYVNSYQDDVAGLLVGGYDGYIRKFDTATKQDDGTLIDSYVLFGPITINKLIRANVKIQEIQITLSEDSEGIEWSLFQGETNESVVKGIKEGTLTATYSGTSIIGGRQITIKEKIAGEAIAIMLRSKTLNYSWGTDGGIKIKYSVLGQTKS